MANEPIKSSTTLSHLATAPAAQDLVHHYERMDLASHPFFVYLNRGDLDMHAVWLLMVNLRAGISRRFVNWLAQTIARLDDRRIASLIAKQLNDELGSGDFSRIHSGLLDQFVSGLEPWRVHDSEAKLLAPGSKLMEQVSALFARPNIYESVGALMTGEIFAKKMDQCLAESLRGRAQLDERALTWLTVHEVLEVDHADDSEGLALLVPQSASVLEAVQRGGSTQWQFLSEFLDGVDHLRREIGQRAAGAA